MKSPLQFNCAKKIFTFLLVIFFFTNLFAKESPVAKDVKKALSSYAGMSELKKRGFNIKSLDTAETMEDVYNTMLPYMIQNGVPLDNAIGFYDKQTYQTYSFKQHYSVNFTDDYGKKEELLNKGYKEDEIFAYFSKGKDVYRAGKFEWQKAKEYPEVGQRMMPQFPPVNGELFIYFWPAFWTEKFYPDYWEQAAKKDFIILDLRLNQGGDYQIGQFFDYLDKVKYQGQIIIIMDSSSAAGEYLYAYRMTTWSNGQEKPRTFRYVSIGENTIGLQNFSDWKRYETDNSIIWGVRQKKNQWKKYDEGVGAMPDIWAPNTEDIFKTIEVITGINNFEKNVATYQKYISMLIKQEQNNLYSLRLPACFGKIKDDSIFYDRLSNFLPLLENFTERQRSLKENYFYSFSLTNSFYQINDDKIFVDYFSKLVKIQERWYDYCFQNIEKKAAIKSSVLYKLDGRINELSVEKYLVELDKGVQEQILKNSKALNDFKGDEYLDFLASKLEFKPDVKKENRRLEGVFLIFNKLEILQNEGFDLHKLDYVTTPEEIINYIQPFFLSKDGYPRDLHTGFSIQTKDNKYYSIKQTSRYIVFNDEYGSKQQLAKKGYVENVTMFYYPYHDGKFWKGKNDWRSGKIIMAMPNYQYRQTEYVHKYYTTEKSVYFKFRNFPHPLNGGPDIEDAELQEMINKLSKETNKENVIFDITKNTGGDGFTSQKISEAVQKSGIKNVYIVMDKGAFSCGDHFPLESKNWLFKNQKVTLVGYPTMGGTSSGDGETYNIKFPDFEVTAEIATTFTQSETEHEGWGATPDVYADNLDDALGAVRTLTGDNEIKPFESEERKQFNKGKTRWLKDDIIFEIKDR